MPTQATAQALYDWATDHQIAWGGGDWRTVYPNTAGIVVKVLTS
jgi:hypothetical protein